MTNPEAKRAAKKDYKMIWLNNLWDGHFKNSVPGPHDIGTCKKIEFLIESEHGVYDDKKADHYKTKAALKARKQAFEEVRYLLMKIRMGENNTTDGHSKIYKSEVLEIIDSLIKGGE